MGSRNRKLDPEARSALEKSDGAKALGRKLTEDEPTAAKRPEAESPAGAGKVDAELLAKIHGDPDEVLHCIVMAVEGLEQLESEMPSSVLVEHRYRLIQGVSVTGSAGAILELSRLPSVKSIESVRPVAPC